jgi:hypothetical protein
VLIVFTYVCLSAPLAVGEVSKEEGRRLTRFSSDSDRWAPWPAVAKTPNCARILSHLKPKVLFLQPQAYVDIFLNNLFASYDKSNAK